MADVLGELFGNIAEAIRSKTGEAGTMKPAEFPDKISAIEASGNGGIGGSGMLPVGVYLGASPIKDPSDYRHRRFMYNGQLYASGSNMVGSGYLNVIYKWDGSAWTTLLRTDSATIGINGCPCGATEWKGVEYNGELHIFEGKNHWVFNGTTLMESVEVPLSGGSNPAVCQGDLYVYGSDNCTLYKWNAETNTWDTLTTHKYVYGPLFSVNGNLYLKKSTEIYRYDEGTLTKVATTPVHFRGEFIIDDTLYGYYNSSFTTWYKVDLINGECVELGNTPRFYSIFDSIGASDISFNAATNSSNNNNYPYFVVNIAEAIE